MSLRYRSDIDGLRAIAVLSVVAYHFGFPILPGGYLGVDVFFVLSGYLITSIILSEMDENAFTLPKFFARRIRRILPALLLVLTVTTVAACLILLPEDLLGFARSQIATLFFFANIYFWRDTNYFSSNAEEKPLLHMWSLGVEEQFYIVFPLILMALAHRSRRILAPVVIALVVVSFLANIALNSIGGRNPAFFLLPTRAWELEAGAILATMRPISPARPWIVQSAAFLGVVLIFLGLGFADQWRGAVPESLTVVVGTSMAIWAGSHGATQTGNVLSLAPMRFFGKISYSLYLWHWPITVLATYYLVRDLSLVENALAFVTMVGAAALSLRFLENPCRSRNVSFRAVGLGVAGATALLLAASVFILRSDGLPGRLPAEAATINAAVGTNFRCALRDFVPMGAARACRLNLETGEPDTAELVFYGNSHAQMYAPIVREITEERNVSSILLPMNACLPLVNVNISLDCVSQADRNLRSILEMPNLSQVVLAFNWEIQSRELVDGSGRIYADHETAILDGLGALLDRLEQANIEPIVIGPIPVPGYDLASRLSRSLAFGRESESPISEELVDFMSRYEHALAPLSDELGHRFVTPHRAICDDQTCHWIVDGRSIFSDGNHVSQLELWRFHPFFDQAFLE